ncbi:hypothetical protein, partial [Cellulophaga sp. BC115SP]|uniref:hypothetical protein n=1 Tax=Cellulophaga sp. BC115SP TaxID=2683263 RepID=UPI00141268CC
MGKQSKSVKGTVAQPNQEGKLAMYEHQENYEDNLLPEAQELAKLKEVDPTLLPWLISRIEKEQDGRLSFNERQITLLEEETKRNYRLTSTSLYLAFFIALAGMGFSAYLVYSNLPIAGSIFA